MFGRQRGSHFALTLGLGTGGWLQRMDIDHSISYFAVQNGGYGGKYMGLSQADRLEHVHVIGKTGMGKSTLIENLIYQDIVH